MFVSHEKSSSKKVYQKPNILRKKPKVSSKCSVPEGHESIENNFSFNFDITQSSKLVNLQRSHNIKTKMHCPSVKTPAKLKDKHIIVQTQDNSKKCEQNKMEERLEQLNSNDDSLEQSLINIDSFLNEDVSSQNILFDVDISTGKHIDCNSQPKWCFNLMDDTQKVVLEDYNGESIGNVCTDQNKDLVTNMVPLSAVSSLNRQSKQYREESLASLTPIPIPSFTIDQFSQKKAMFVCDKPNCNKKFKIEQKFKKHLESHNKETNGRQSRQATNKCPVKKVLADGSEQPCGKIFLVKEDLLKHFNEDHTLEEAPYECESCSRRFFFAAGLCAHVRAHAPSPPRLRCAWAGCAREFRLPCRLREHTRSHTGDKPYHCPYPSCESSFRTASKLLRHARRHTGERRHACGACGRAFLRREHLRGHVARHKPPPAKHKHPCTYTDCTQTFTTAKLLGVHVKRLHKKEKSIATTVPKVPLLKLESESVNNFMVSLKDEVAVATEAACELPEGAIEQVEVVSEDLQVSGGEALMAGEEVPLTGAELHAARTHCTWPLQRNYALPDTVLVVEEDYQNEPSESSESHIFTVRSDLFLHGNVLNNEDSEQMASSGIGGEAGESRSDTGEAGESRSDTGGVSGDVTGDVTGDMTSDMDVTGAGLVDLGLLDTHSTIDLMQEELMYTDAVDESSFQVLLLRGEL